MFTHQVSHILLPELTHKECALQTENVWAMSYTHKFALWCYNGIKRVEMFFFNSSLQWVLFFLLYPYVLRGLQTVFSSFLITNHLKFEINDRVLKTKRKKKTKTQQCLNFIFFLFKPLLKCIEWKPCKLGVTTVYWCAKPDSIRCFCF